MKAFTDLEQSKKLAEILPLESADMYWDYDFQGQEYKYYPKVMDDQFDDVCTLCWSLAALLDVIHKHIKDYNVLRIDISENEFAIWYDEIGYGVNTEFPDITKASAVDACVEMIVKLKEKKLI